MKDKDMTDWFVELDVDMDKVMQIARWVGGLIDLWTYEFIDWLALVVYRAILSLYTMWKDFDDRAQIPEILKKIPSPKLPWSHFWSVFVQNERFSSTILFVFGGMVARSILLFYIVFLKKKIAS